ncbi:hypothetical protein AB1N83_005143 [Pleurotus pulmonarius]
MRVRTQYRSSHLACSWILHTAYLPYPSQSARSVGLKETDVLRRDIPQNTGLSYFPTLPPSSHISSPLVYSLAIPSLVKSTPISSSNELGLKYLEYTPKRSEGTLSKEEKGGLYARRWIDASI